MYDKLQKKLRTKNYLNPHSIKKSKEEQKQESKEENRDAILPLIKASPRNQQSKNLLKGNKNL